MRATSLRQTSAWLFERPRKLGRRALAEMREVQCRFTLLVSDAAPKSNVEGLEKGTWRPVKT
eukprot:3109924-Alexandrium_andersonii.AAC.1